MKTPEELAVKLTRQWEIADLREKRLTQHGAWPLSLSIGRPTAREIRYEPGRVREHIQAWRAVRVGTVEWTQETYRDTGEAVETPSYWRIATPSEWVAAAESTKVATEYAALNQLCDKTGERYHRLWIRQRSLWRSKPLVETIQAASLADQLKPGYAKGAPLRTLSAVGNDTKFFERNRGLLVSLLDLRFEGEVGKIGLESFLGAMPEGDHWLLLADMDGGLLPFTQMRVRASDLFEVAGLPGEGFLIVENERCLFLLPKRPGVLAILGGGLNLSWLSAQVFENKPLAYWGDLDTWGLYMLSLAKARRRDIQPLLMTREVFDNYSSERAVCESVKTPLPEAHSLAEEEVTLFGYLAGLEKGRLEQEFLPAELVAEALEDWAENSD